jgi:hypothetical protein
MAHPAGLAVPQKAPSTGRSVKDEYAGRFGVGVFPLNVFREESVQAMKAGEVARTVLTFD